MPEDVRAEARRGDRRGGQGARHPEKIPRHRLRADRAGRRGVHRPPRRRGQALGGVSDRGRLAEIVSMAPSPAAPIVSLRGVGKLFGTGTRGARRARSRRARRRIPVAARARRAAASRRRSASSPGLSEPSRGTVAWRDGARCPPRHRLRVPGADLDALDDGVRQCLPAAQARRHRQGRGRAAHHGNAGARRPCRLRRRLSARTVRRHADAGVDRARARHRAAHPADGRAVRGARRDHALQAQRRSGRAVARASA